MTIRAKLRHALLVLLDDDKEPSKLSSPALTPAASSTSPAPVPGRCGSCKHFDHEAGQEALKQNPAMLAASATIPPWAMGRKVTRDDEGRLIPPAGTSKDWLKAKWADLGACGVREEGVFPFDTCEKYEART